MNRNVILLVDADAESCAATEAAARITGLDVRFAQIRRDLSEITGSDMDDVAVIVLDFELDVHGASLSAMLQDWQPPRPVILISSAESAPHPMMLLCGRAKHLSKPVSVERLSQKIKALVLASQTHFDYCDRWGHPCSRDEDSRAVAVAHTG